MQIQKEDNLKKRVIILGGGFAGVTLAKTLLKKYSKTFSVILADKNDFQTFYPAFFSVIPSQAELSDLFSVVALKFSDIFEKASLQVLKREVASISFDQNSIFFKIVAKAAVARKLNYDYLVVALGGVEQAVDGKSNIYNLHSPRDLFALKNSFETLFKSKAKKDNIMVTVMGGGVTGCSLACFLSEYGDRLCHENGHPLTTVKLNLCEKHGHLLRRVSPWFRQKMEQCLWDKKINIICNVDSPDPMSDMVIDTTGMAPVRLWSEAVKISPSLNLSHHKNVFAIQSSSAVSAIRQAKYVAKALYKMEKKFKPRNYKEKKDSLIVEAGSDSAFADLGFIKFSGRLAAWLHRLAVLRHLVNIMGFTKTCEWFRLFKNL